MSLNSASLIKAEAFLVQLFLNTVTYSLTGFALGAMLLPNREVSYAQKEPLLDRSGTS